MQERQQIFKKANRQSDFVRYFDMLDRFNEPFHGVLLNNEDRKAGSFVDDKGNKRDYDAAHVLSVIQLGDRRGLVKKFSVLPELEDSIRRQLETVSWGALVTLQFDGNRVSDVSVDLDWASEISD